MTTTIDKRFPGLARLLTRTSSRVYQHHHDSVVSPLRAKQVVRLYTSVMAGTAGVKRAASPADSSLSPPPVKRKIESTTTSKVHFQTHLISG